MAKQALEGIKICDFTWLLAGPWVTKVMADQGAMVVRIESESGVGFDRVSSATAGSGGGLNRAGYFAIYNNNKYSIALDLHYPKAREVAKRLVAWADVVTENFSPGAMEGWGLGYEDLKKVNDDIIMFRVCMHGQTGVSASRVGYGTHLQAEAGFTEFLGYPGGEPLVHPGWTDFTTAWYGTMAIVCAIKYRDKTGKGMLLDMSNYESGVCFIGPALLDYSANKRVETRMGNRHLSAAPHGTFRCKGDDRWCAIAVFNEKEWQALCKAMGKPELAKDARFSTQELRKQNEDELERLIEAWTITLPPRLVMTRLQTLGVPAGMVQTAEDLDGDAQLEYRQHWVRLEHPEMGVVAFETPSYRFSKTPYEIRRCPLLGEHTEYVCRELLGMSDEEFVGLLQEGIFH